MFSSSTLQVCSLIPAPFSNACFLLLFCSVWDTQDIYKSDAEELLILEEHQSVFICVCARSLLAL